MGRSKFPGKPSKSINRKRISVLQLDEDASTTAATEPEDGVSASATTRVGGDKRGGGGGNCDDDKDGHNKKGGGPGGGGVGGIGGGGGSEAGTSGGAGGGGARNGRNVNGNNSAANNGSSNGASGGSGTSASDTVATHRQCANARNTTDTAMKRAAVNGVSGSKSKSRSSNRGKSRHKDITDKKLATALDDNKQRDESIDKADNETRATRHTKTVNDTVDVDCPVAVAAHNAKKQLTAITTMATEDDDKMDANAALVQEYAENDEDDSCDVDGVADDDDDIDEDEYEDDNASSTSRKSQQSGCSTASTTNSSSITTTNCSSTTTIALAFSRSKRDGKFKNLNLAKPEVMLPSSAKLRQLQKQNQLNCSSPPPTGAATTTNDGGGSSGNNNTALTSCNNKSTTSIPAATTASSTVVTSLFTRISNPFALADKLCATTNDTDDDEASCIMAVDAAINGSGVDTSIAQNGDSSVGGVGVDAAAGVEDGCADNEDAAMVSVFHCIALPYIAFIIIVIIFALCFYNFFLCNAFVVVVFICSVIICICAP